jgi:hypothetical protein
MEQPAKNNKFMKLLQSIFFLLLANLVVGQNNPLSIHQIDSLAATIDTTKDLRTTISDGEIRPKGKKKPKGGFSDTYYVAPAANQLVKVEHGESLYTDNFASYYFYNDNLILVKTEFHNSKGPSFVLANRYYFYNGILFNKQEEGRPLSKPEALLQHAARYLEDVKNMFNQ